MQKTLSNNYLIIGIILLFNITCNNNKASQDNVATIIKNENYARLINQLKNPQQIPQNILKKCVTENLNLGGEDKQAEVYIPENENIVIKKILKAKTDIIKVIERNIIFLEDNIKNIYKDKENNYFIIMKKINSVNPSDITVDLIEEELKKLEEKNKFIFHLDIHPENIKIKEGKLVFIDPADPKSQGNPLYYCHGKCVYENSIKDRIALIKSLFFMRNAEELKLKYGLEKLDRQMFKKIIMDVNELGFENAMKNILKDKLINDPSNILLIGLIKKYNF